MNRSFGQPLFDAIWSLGHPQTYGPRVGDAGWTVKAYCGWLLRSLGAALA